MTFTETIELKDQNYIPGTPILLLSYADVGVMAAVGKDLADSDYELYYSAAYPINSTIMRECIQNPDIKYVIILNDWDHLSKDEFKEAYELITTRISNGYKIPDNVELCARIAVKAQFDAKHFNTEYDANEFYSNFMVIRPDVEQLENHKYRIGFRL